MSRDIVDRLGTPITAVFGGFSGVREDLPNRSAVGGGNLDVAAASASPPRNLNRSAPREPL
jgi:hypothetical protein